MRDRLTALDIGMANDGFAVRFWGTRGSIPVSGPDHVRFGGNTACVEMICGDTHLLFDAGSGLRQAGDALVGEGIKEFNLFFTHCHYDHIIGLPFFKPVYMKGASVTLWSGHLAGKMTTGTIIDQFVRTPWMPEETCYVRAALNYRDFQPGDVLTPGAGIAIQTRTLRHNGGCVGYRVEWSGRAVALIFDFEHKGNELDAGVLELMRGAGLAVYDSNFTEAEMPGYIGYGHSTPQRGIAFAKAAGVARLALFHHAPSRSDNDIVEIERIAQAELPGAFAARDGQVVSL